MEAQLCQAQAEILTLSKALLQVPSAPDQPTQVDLKRPTARSNALPRATVQAMFEVMALSLPLTRVPFVMRIGYFRRRHRRRLANALVQRGLIDTAWYLATYPEAAKSGLPPAIYFVSRGMAAGHVPHPMFASEEQS